MKTILELNKEQQGLKLIQVNEGFLVVDCSKECYDNPKIWNYSTNTGFIFQGYRRSYGADYDQSFEIIFATPNLNLKDIPNIEYYNPEIIDFAKDSADKEIKTNGELKLGFISGFCNGYKQAQQILFTEKQIFQIIETYLKWIYENKNSLKTGKEVIFEIIKSIKKPKVEIEFDENNKPIKCIIL